MTARSVLWVVCTLVVSTSAWSAEVCPSGRPDGLDAAGPEATALLARISEAVGVRAGLGISASVSAACVAPEGIFHQPGWVSAADLVGDAASAPAAVLYAWLLASHSAVYAPGPRDARIAREPDFVAGCAVARLGAVGDALARHAETLVTRTGPAGASAEVQAKRRAVFARGARSCR